MIGTLLIFGLGTPEIVLIAIVILVLFGAKKIPEMMHGVGKGIREFKKASRDDDDNPNRHIHEEENKSV